MFQSMLVRLKDFDGVPESMKGGFDEGVPFLLIVIFLAIVGKNLPQRGTLIEPALTPTGFPRFPARWVVGCGLAAALVMLVADRTIRFPLIISLIAAVLALSQVVLTGYLGQISLAQLTFPGAAGYLLAKLTTGWGWACRSRRSSPSRSPPHSGCWSAFLPCASEAFSLAMVTLAFAIAAEQLVFRNLWFSGPASVATIASPRVAGVDLGILGTGEFPQRPFGLIIIALAAGCFALVANLRRSSTGRKFLAVRANERAAAASGIDVSRVKLIASSIASFLASTSGVMLGYASVNISSSGYETRFPLALLALGFLAGIGRLSGAASRVS